MSDTRFYRAFEDRHRGPRELIRTRLEAYRPFIEALAEFYPSAPAVDLGCGRGEWLELLRDGGFKPCGVDLDEGMLAACIERGLPVFQGDAIAYLKTLGDETQCIVSGFHIVEHIPFEALDALVAQALRVLKPGGLLILETPNPENVVVGTCNFYLDPTHTRPIPPTLLSFLPEYHGYERVRVLRLQEDKSLHARHDVGLIEVLGGVSPDYAVVAQKGASPRVLKQFDAAFEAEYGIALHQLAGRYDQKMERIADELRQRLAVAEAQAGGVGEAMARITVLQDRLIALATEQAKTEAKALASESRMQEAESRMQEAESRMQESETRQRDLQTQVDQINGHAHHWWQQACALEAERNSLCQSRSWRYTAPLRIGVKWLRSGIKKILYAAITVLHRPLARLIKVVLQRPMLKQYINQRLIAHPYLRMRIKEIAQSAGILHKPFIYPSSSTQQQESSSVLTNLTPRAREIYVDLKAAIECKRGNS